MKAKAPAASGVKPVYEDFEPSSEWKREKDCDTLVIFLQGFKKDQLRVQLTTSRTLKIRGERPLGNNKWSRFQKEFPVSENCDTNRITANFELSRLEVRQPKIITPAPPQHQDKVKQSQEPLPKRDAQEPAAQQVTSSTPSLDKQANGKAAAETAPEKENSKEQPKATNGKISSSISTDSNNVTQKKSEEKSGGKVTSCVTNSIDNAAKMDGEACGWANGVRGQLMELKKPTNLMKLLVALVLALAFGFYVTNSTKFYVKSKQN